MILIVIALLLIYIVFIYRFYIFGIKTPEMYGFGTHINTTTQCVNTSGLCSEVGTIVNHSYCQPNSQTGRGCLLNGVQTFESQNTTQTCSIPCRKTVWEITTSPCIATSPICAEYNEVGTTTTAYKCVANDKTGENTCVLHLNTGYTINDPSLCSLNKAKSIATCKEGAIVTLQNECLPEKEKICGTYALQKFDKSFTPCKGNQDQILISNVCYNLITGERMFQLEELYNLGYIKYPMTCTGSTVCRPPDNCVTTQPTLTIFDTQNEAIGCQGNTVDCILPCLYFEPLIFTTDNMWNTILKLPIFIRGVSGVLTLKYTPPCTATNGFLAECYGFAGTDPIDLCLVDTSYFATPICSTAQVMYSSAPLFFIKPLRRLNYDNKFYLQCVIFGVFESKYFGYLDVVNDQLKWIPTTLMEIGKLTTLVYIQNYGTTYDIVYNLDINWVSSPLNPHPYEDINIYSYDPVTTTATLIPLTSGYEFISLPPTVTINGTTNSTYFNGGSETKVVPMVGVDNFGISNLLNIEVFLNYRATRHNINNCNLFAHTPNPLTYPFKDTSVSEYEGFKYSN